MALSLRTAVALDDLGALAGCASDRAPQLLQRRFGHLAAVKVELIGRICEARSEELLQQALEQVHLHRAVRQPVESAVDQQLHAVARQ